ncbi:glycosyltransferase [Bifidobacterium adolescentis]|uniref:Glycosyltransferase n=1 Tax=Bifidobacterium adolescentis TaxID=1680 RepID=A0A412K739_BIFAD|nr:glycosyltransferase [Bifidobacterium adolescentis]RGV15752.1 glycosyltransferase [Bifidobacterium adolescentis]
MLSLASGRACQTGQQRKSSEGWERKMNDTMQDRPYITVMVPVYNGENFLRQAVDSVLSQPCGDFEVLIHR